MITNIANQINNQFLRFRPALCQSSECQKLLELKKNNFDAYIEETKSGAKPFTGCARENKHPPASRKPKSALEEKVIPPESSS